MEEDVFLIYGVPQYLLCDNGQQYTSHFLKSLVRSYDCQLIFNANFSPQCNPTERVNTTLKTMIRSFVKHNQRERDVNLSKLGFALRTAIHEVTGYSPAYLNFGRDPFISGKMYKDYNVLQGKAPLEVSHTSKLSSHLEILRNLCNEVRSRLNKAYEQSSSRYNLRHRPVTLDVGQIVWKKNYCLSDKSNYFSSKLDPKCKVRKKISTNVYELESLDSRKSLGSWHIKDIKLDEK